MIEALRRCQRGNDGIWQRTQSLGRIRFPPRLHFPCSRSDSTWGFPLLLSHPALPRTMSFDRKKLSNPGFDFFPSTTSSAPNPRFSTEKMADELLKAKVHSSAITQCFFSSWWKTGSTGSQPPRKSKGGKISHRNVVCHKLQPWP